MTAKDIAPEEWDSYQDIHDRAMVDLVRDPRYVVYAADALIAKLVAAVEEQKQEADLRGEAAALLPPEWHRQWDSLLSSLRARAARDRETCRLHADGSTEDCVPGHDCAECERGEER